MSERWKRRRRGVVRTVAARTGKPGGRTRSFLRRGRLAALAALLPVAFSAACSAGRPSPPASLPMVHQAGADSSAPGLSDRNDQLQSLAAAASRSPAPGSPSGYIVGAGDLLRVDVFGAEELSGERRVSPRGEIALPLLGPVSVEGLSTRELEVALEERLGEQYMKDPHVTVEITEMNSRGVSVIGAVRGPGVYQLSGRATLLEMLAQAEGLAENAGNTVLLSRSGDGSEGASSQRVDLGELLAGGDLSRNVPIRPGDVIEVPEAGFVYVTGQVEDPGGFPVRRGSDMTAVQALSLAGGLTNRAAAGSSWIIRVDENDRRRDIPVDLDEVLAMNAESPRLSPGDVLYVPRSTSKTIFGGLWEAVLRVVTLGTIGL